LGINKEVIKLDPSNYIFVESFRFGLCYVLREIYEEGFEKCIEVWKEMKPIYSLSNLSNEKLKNILSTYYQKLPSTYTKEAKETLLPTTIDLLRRIVLELNDTEALEEFSKSASFSEWIKQYYSFIEDGSLYSGFRGKSLSKDSDAIYLHKNSFWKIADILGFDKAIQSHTHTVIHEVMHLHSWQGEGANTFTKFSEITKEFNPLQKLDEGFTEIFSRIIVYRIQANRELLIPASEIPIIFLQGKTIADVLPVYEGLKDFACNIANYVQLENIVQGYFLGNWQPLLSSLQSSPIFKNPNVWKCLCSMSHSAVTFQNQDDLIRELQKLGLDLVLPSDLKLQVKENQYKDKLKLYFSKYLT